MCEEVPATSNSILVYQHICHHGLCMRVSYHFLILQCCTKAIQAFQWGICLCEQNGKKNGPFICNVNFVQML